MKHRVPRRVERGERFGFGAARRRASRAGASSRARGTTPASPPRARRRRATRSADTRSFVSSAHVTRVRYRVPRVRARPRRAARATAGTRAGISNAPRVPTRTCSRTRPAPRAAPRRARRAGLARARRLFSRGSETRPGPRRRRPGSPPRTAPGCARRADRASPRSSTALWRPAPAAPGPSRATPRGRRTRGRRRPPSPLLVVADRVSFSRDRVSVRAAPLSMLSLVSSGTARRAARATSSSSRRPAHGEHEEPLQFVVHAAEGEDVQLARLRDVAHGDGERVLPRRARIAPTSSLVQSPSPQRPSLARTTSARASAAASFVSRSCCAAKSTARLMLARRAPLVAEHRERHAGRRPGSHGEAGARGREVLPARAPVVREDALRAILVELHGRR